MSSIFNIQKSFRISLGSPKPYAKGAVFTLAAMWLALPSAVSAATITASLKPAFQADLTSTLKLQAGSGSPTFTRATTAYVQDFEGLLKPVLSGEARFQGARRVENLVTVSETSNVNTAVTVTPNALSKPLTGYSSAALAVPTTASSIHRLIPGITQSLGVGSTVWYVAVVKAAGYSKVAIREQVTDTTEVAFDLGSGTILYESYTSATNGLATITSKGNGWYQIAVRKRNSGNTGPFMNLVILPDSYTTGATTGAWVADGSSGIYVTGFQEEDQTGQSNMNPSEYVSKGVLAAPYHGAGVDGVKYFSTMNGNTVTSNVVTAATGPAINSSTAKFAQLPGTSGSYFSTPDSTVNSITGAIDIRAKVALDDWTPSAFQTLVAKDTASGRSYVFGVDSTSSGALYFQFTTDGVNVLTPATSSAVNTFANGTAHWVRMTHNPATGKVNFYTSDDGATWTSLGVEQTVTVGTVADTSSPISLGAFGTGGTLRPMTGKLYHAQIYNGIAGTLSVNFNPNTWTSGSTWTAGTTGETWTIGGGASVFAGTGLWDSAGPMGYFSEGARTNLLLQSNAVTTSPWATILSSALQNVKGPDGATSAWTLSDSDGVSNLYIQQSATVSVAPLTISFYVKKTVGAQASYPVLESHNGAGTNTALLTIDTTNGIVTPWTAYTGLTIITSTGTITDAGNGYWRVSQTFTPTGTTLVTSLNAAGTTNATQSTGVVDGTAQGTTVIYGMQLEQAAFASSYIPTTTGSATRDADVLTYSATNNLNNSAGTIYGEVQRSTEDPVSARWFGNSTASANRLEFSTEALAHRFSYGTGAGFQQPIVGVPVAGSIAKVSGKWSSSGGIIYANGTAGSSSGTAAAVTAGSSLYIGAGLNGASPFYGTIRNVKIWKKALTGSQLTTMTTSSTATSRAAIPQTTVKAPTKTGLVGAWTFDEGTGTKANDSSGTGNSGTLSGAVLPSWTKGKLGRALSFDGNSSYVSSGTNLGMSGDFSGTASAWVLRSVTSGSTFQAVFVAGSAATLQSFGLGINGGSDGDVTIQFNGGKGRYSAGGLIPLNTWTHIAVTKTAGAIESTSHLYINGVEVAQAGGQTGTPNFVASVNNIGKWTANGYGFKGLIDDVRVYNRALSATEINALYRSTATAINTSTNTSLTSGLTGLWSFDGKDMNWGVGKGALDRSGNGNNGLFSGMSTTTSPTIGKIGQALSFNGANGVAVSNAASINHGSGDFSIALWYKDGPNVVDANDLIGKGSGAFNVSGIGWELRARANDTALEFCVNGGGTCPRIVVSGLTAKVWKHVVVTVSRTNALSTMYVNGGSVVGTMASAPTYTDAYGMTIGYGHDSLLNGKIDDVRLYNRALSATEAKALYNLGR